MVYAFQKFKQIYRHIKGEVEFPEFLGCVESLYFCYIGPMASYETLGQLFKTEAFSVQKMHSGGGLINI